MSIDFTGTEAAVVGAAILNPSMLDSLADLSPLDFADAHLGKVFATMRDLHNAGERVSDPVLLARRLKAADLLAGIGGEAGIVRLAQACPNPAHAPHYGREIANTANLRKLQGFAASLWRRARSPKADAAKLADWADAELSTHRADVAAETVSLADAVNDALNYIESLSTADSAGGLEFGLQALDDVIAMHPGQLVTLAARTSIGKSALALQTATSCAQRGEPTLYVSLEMDTRDLAFRKVAEALGIEVRVLMSGYISPDQIAEARKYAESLRKVPLYLYCPDNATLAQIRAKARVMQATVGLRLLVVDHLGCVTPHDPGRPRDRLQVAKLTWGFKSLAKELKCPILLLSQLNRIAEGETPGVHHLAESSTLENDSDTVLLLHRPTRDSPKATVIIAKARNAQTGPVDLDFDKVTVSFSSPDNDAYSKFA